MDLEAGGQRFVDIAQRKRELAFLVGLYHTIKYDFRDKKSGIPS
jgi:hypothetical protein